MNIYEKKDMSLEEINEFFKDKLENNNLNNQLFLRDIHEIMLVCKKANMLENSDAFLLIVRMLNVKL